MSNPNPQDTPSQTAEWEAFPTGSRKIVMDLAAALDPTLLASPAIEKAVEAIDATLEQARVEVARGMLLYLNESRLDVLLEMAEKKSYDRAVSEMKLKGERHE